MGLLDRAQVLDDQAVNEDQEEPTQRAGAIVSSFRHAPEHIDYSGEFFDAYRSLLGFTKGTLMFPDDVTGEYYPWITEGLDRTSSRRLRIPFDYPGLVSENLWNESINSDDLAQWLSNREFGLAEKVLIVRAGSESPSPAIILALDCNVVPSENEALGEALNILAEELSAGLKKSRNLMNSLGDEDVVDPLDWIDSWGKREASLVILDTSPAIDALMETVRGLELYRARRDVISMVRNITGRMGRIHDLKDGRVIILFPEDRLPDHDLYLHQLSLSFSASVLDLPSPPAFPAEFHKLPDDRAVLEEVLAGFASK